MLHRFTSDYISNLVKNQGINVFNDTKDLTLAEFDVKSFNTEKGQVTPNDMINILNIYLSFIAESIIFNDGIVERFNGDSVIAVFGLSKEDPASGKSACKAAKQAVEKCRTISLAFELSIGIHKGMTIYGFFGGNQHIEFMTIGDTRNLVGRIQSLNNVYKTNIIVSDTVRETLDENFPVREIDTIAVRGKLNALRIFELL
jgi:adenylate cyclase